LRAVDLEPCHRRLLPAPPVRRDCDDRREAASPPAGHGRGCCGQGGITTHLWTTHAAASRCGGSGPGRAGPAPARSARRRPRHRGPVVPAQTAACGLPLACAACRPLGALEASTLPVGGGRGTALVGTLLRLTACELDPAGGRPGRGDLLGCLDGLAVEAPEERSEEHTSELQSRE